MRRTSLRRRLVAAAIVAVLAPAAGSGAEVAGGVTETPPRSLVARIPPRPHGARTGTEFAAYVGGMNPAARERAIRDEILSGNIPSFLRRLKPLELSCCDSTPRRFPASRARVWVMPDYLAIGSDRDFVRFPANFDTATSSAFRPISTPRPSSHAPSDSCCRRRRSSTRSIARPICDWFRSR